MKMNLKCIRSLWHQQHGNVLLLTGLSILLLFAAGGAGIDFGRQQLVRMRLQQASDAAALAAAAMPYGTSVGEREAVATQYYNLNFPDPYLGVGRPTPGIDVGASVEVTAHTNIETNFIRNLDIENLQANARTVVGISTTPPSSADVILVMDNSGSMSASAIAPGYVDASPAQTARNEAVNYCAAFYKSFTDAACAVGGGDFGLLNEKGKAHYSTADQCRNNYPKDLCQSIDTGLDKDGSKGDKYTAFGLRDQTRLSALRKVALDFTGKLFDDKDTTSRVALVSWSDILMGVQPLTDNKAVAQKAINGMGAFGATNFWLGLNKAQELTKDYDKDHTHFVILLTDGYPTAASALVYNGTTYQDGDGCNGGDFCAKSIQKAEAVCDQLKKNGNTRIHVIAFGEDIDDKSTEANDAQTFLKKCASNRLNKAEPAFDLAKDGVALQEIFDSITDEIRQIQITE